MVSSMLVNVDTRFDDFLSCRVALIQRSEELLVFVSDKQEKARSEYAVSSRQNPGPLLKVSPDWAMLLPSSRRAGRNG